MRDMVVMFDGLTGAGIDVQAAFVENIVVLMNDALPFKSLNSAIT